MDGFDPKMVIVAKGKLKEGGAMKREVSVEYIGGIYIVGKRKTKIGIDEGRVRRGRGRRREEGIMDGRER